MRVGSAYPEPQRDAALNIARSPSISIPQQPCSHEGEDRSDRNEGNEC
jgi:hypothetical protein